MLFSCSGQHTCMHVYARTHKILHCSMAVASAQKLEDIIECPICLETLTEPRMLVCFHFYCQKCIHDMNEVKHDQMVGFECPL